MMSPEDALAATTLMQFKDIKIQHSSSSFKGARDDDNWTPFFGGGIAMRPISFEMSNNTMPKVPKHPEKLTKNPPRTLSKDPVENANENDIYFGRGGRTNNNPGNIRFRDKVNEVRERYEKLNECQKSEKELLSKEVIDVMLSENRRFLQRAPDAEGWYEVDYNGARKKASQALREKPKPSRQDGSSRSVMSVPDDAGMFGRILY